MSSGSHQRNTKNWMIVLLSMGGTGVCLLWVLWALPLPERLSASGSKIISFEDGVPAHVFLSSDDKWRIATELDEVDPDYLKALVRYEDKRFWWHPGVDPIALARAVAVNTYHGQVKTGASTLTMQFVRVLEPRPRTLTAKITEMVRAFQLEMHFSKNEILEKYIQYVSFGKNLEGVQAASWSYFGHGAQDLSPAEIATLLAVPQRPQERYPRRANVQRLKQARDTIASALAEWNVLPLGHAQQKVTTTDMLKTIKHTSVPAKLLPLPREIPHSAYWLSDQKKR